MRIGIDAHFLEKHYGGLTTFLKGILGTLMDADLCRSERIDSDIKNEYYLFFQYRNPVRLTIDYPITQSPIFFIAQSLDLMESHLHRTGAEYEILSSAQFK